MRKLIASVLAVGVAAIPAVALAAVDENQTTTEPGRSQAELMNDAQYKLTTAKRRAKRERQELRERRERKAAKARAAGAPQGASGGGGGASPALEAIAACESGGNPQAIGGGGAYRGKYQFDRGTWASVGGSGDPAAASEAEQDRRAAMLYARVGASAWPTCGQ